ncbi:MAG: hypothetical protein WCX65_01355, partial [bacterium]
MKQGNAGKHINAAKIIFLLMAAAGFAHAFLPGSGITAPLSPGEAKTILFADNYFTITFLKSLYGHSLPLYYLAAHFIAFLPREIVALRLFSFLFFLGALYSTAKLFVESAPPTNRKSGIPTAIYSGLLFLALSPLMLYYSCKAEPFSFAVCLLSFSCMFFQSAFVNKTGSAKPFIFIFALALFTTHVAAAFLAVFVIYLAARISDEKDRPAARAAVKTLLICYIPCVLFSLLGIIKTNSFYIYVFEEGKPAIAYFISYFQSALSRIFSGNPLENDRLAFAALTAIAIPVSLYRAFAGAGRSSANVFIKAFPVFLASVALGIIFHINITVKFSANVIFSNVFAYAQKNIARTDGLLFLDSRDNDDYWLFKYHFRNSGVPNLALSSKIMKATPFNLGSSFKKYEINRRETADMIAIKELFLDAGDIWRFIDTCPSVGGEKPTTPLQKEFQKWRQNVAWARIYSADEKTRCAMIERISLKPGFHKDAILLDLFVNDYKDAGKVARLI